MIFDDSCEDICNSQAFVDFADAGRYGGLSTIHIKHILFYQSKFGRDVDLQNTHIVLFKSPLDVMQVSTLSAQLGLGSELVDWYRDATSVPYCHLLIDFSQGTDDRLRYCTNTESIPPKFFIPDWLKFLDNEQTKSLYSLRVAVLFLQMQQCFPSVLWERVYPVSLGMRSKSSQKKPARLKKTSLDEVSKRNAIALSERNHLEAKKRRTGISKRTSTLKSPYSSRH